MGIEVENILERFANPRDIFSVEQIEILMADFNITEMTADEVRLSLCATAEVYVWNMAYDGPFPPKHEIESELKRIQKQALKLKGLMENAPLVIGRLLERPDLELDGNRPTFPFNFESTQNILGTLAKRSEAAIELAPGMPKGKRASHALGRWADGMKVLFENKLNRKFTVDYDGDTPFSEAARFSVQALQMIFPEVKSREVITALRTSRKA